MAVAASAWAAISEAGFDAVLAVAGVTAAAEDEAVESAGPVDPETAGPFGAVGIAAPSGATSMVAVSTRATRIAFERARMAPRDSASPRMNSPKIGR